MLIYLGKSSSRHVLISDVRGCCAVTVLLVQIKRRNLELGEIQCFNIDEERICVHTNVFSLNLSYSSIVFLQLYTNTYNLTQ